MLGQGWAGSSVRQPAARPCMALNTSHIPLAQLMQVPPLSRSMLRSWAAHPCMTTYLMRRAERARRFSRRSWLRCASITLKESPSAARVVPRCWVMPRCIGRVGVTFGVCCWSCGVALGAGLGGRAGASSAAALPQRTAGWTLVATRCTLPALSPCSMPSCKERQQRASVKVAIECRGRLGGHAAGLLPCCSCKTGSSGRRMI